MCDETLWGIALGINKRDMRINVANSLQLIGMTMVVRAPIDTDQENGDVNPIKAEKIELELVHVGRFAVE